MSTLGQKIQSLSLRTANESALFAGLSWPATRQQLIDYVANKVSSGEAKDQLTAELRSLPDDESTYKNIDEVMKSVTENRARK